MMHVYIVVCVFLCAQKPISINSKWLVWLNAPITSHPYKYRLYSIYFNIYFSRAQAKTGSSTVTWLQTWNKQLKWRRINCRDIISHNIHSFHRQQIHLETFQQGREANLFAWRRAKAGSQRQTVQAGIYLSASRQLEQKQVRTERRQTHIECEGRVWSESIKKSKEMNESSSD